MKYATFLTVVLMGIMAYLTISLSQPFLMVIGLLVLPSIIEGMPWGLLTNNDDSEEPEPQDDYQGTRAGFTPD